MHRSPKGVLRAIQFLARLHQRRHARLDSVKTAWRATCRRAEIADLHFHDLRREAACRWFEEGVPLHHIRDFLGRADISTTSRYLSVTPMELKRSLHAAEAVRNARQGKREKARTADLDRSTASAKKRPYSKQPCKHRAIWRIWSGREDLNLRPLGPEPRCNRRILAKKPQVTRPAYRQHNRSTAPRPSF